MPEFTNIKKPWYKRGWGVVLIIIFCLLMLGVMGFMALFGYYAWQIKYGSAEQLTKISKQFSVDFSISQSLVNANSGQAEVKNYLDYVRKSDPVFGNKQAKITIIAFIDFECPYSQKAYADFQQVMEKYEPVAKVVFKNTPLSDIHPNAMPAAEAGMCAEAQNKFWQYHSYLFTAKLLDKDSLLNAAEAIGLDKNKFLLCLEKEQYKKDIEQDLRDALSMGVNGTPTYFVNGVKVVGVLSIAEWDKIIIQFLK